LYDGLQSVILPGPVQTIDPDKTEVALRSVMPKKHWIEWNYVCVMMGQNGCLTKKGCGKGLCPFKKALQLDS
jgi:endonuclease III